MRFQQSKERNSDAGSALVWTMAVMLILSVLLTSALTMGLMYANRSIRNNNERQAYFTARSGAQMLADAICTKSASGNTLLDELNQSPTLTIPNLNLDPRMGTCSAEITMETTQEEGKVIRIVASSSYQGSTHSMRVTLVPGETDVTLSNASFQRGLYLENLGDNGNIQIQRNIDLGADTDFYFKLAASSDKWISFVTKKGMSVVMRRNLLANRPLILNNSSGQMHIHGMVISDQDISLTGVTVGPVSGDSCGGTAPESGIYSMGSVTLSGSTVVYGDIVARSVTLNDNAVVVGKIGTLGGTTQINGSARHDGVDYALTVNPIPSRLPDVSHKVITEPVGSIVQPLTQSMIQSGQRIGSGDAGATYYYIDSQISLPTTSILTKPDDAGKVATGPVYVFLRQGASVDIAAVQPDPKASSQTPRVIFVLENSTATLNIHGGYSSVVECAAHIVGEGNVTIGDNALIKGVVSVTGTLSWLDQGSGGYLRVDSAKPPAELFTVTGGGSGGTDGAETILGWKVQRYEEV